MSDEPYDLYVNEARTVLVRVWSSGWVEVCLRDHPGAIWGLSIPMKAEALT